MRKLLLRKKFYSAALVSALAFSLIGCKGAESTGSTSAGTGSQTSAETPAGEEGQPAAENTAEPTTLTVMVYERGNTTETWFPQRTITGRAGFSRSLEIPTTLR
ncbi:MAG: hypothetical protein ACLUOI_01300 [Eisenbergiella sp.]